MHLISYKIKNNILVFYINRSYWKHWGVMFWIIGALCYWERELVCFFIKQLQYKRIRDFFLGGFVKTSVRRYSPCSVLNFPRK
jgi:hypothetical protein